MATPFAVFGEDNTASTKLQSTGQTGRLETALPCDALFDEGNHNQWGQIVWSVSLSQNGYGYIIEFGLQAKPTILYVGFIFLAASRDCHYNYRRIYKDDCLSGDFIITCWRP